MNGKESVMHKKFSNLQLKLLDYKVIEKVKRSLESNEPTVENHKLRKERKPGASRKKSLFLAVCIICPFLFPVFVYFEYPPLFWPAAGFSTFSGVFLILYLSSRIPILMAAFHKMFYGAHSRVKIVVQDTEYFSHRRRIQSVLLVAVILLILGIGHWAGGNNPVLFNSCLVAVGYIAGILSVSLYGFLVQSKRLPHLSPLHKKRDGPNKPAKRELDFSSPVLTSSSGLSPMTCFNPSPEREKKCNELIHRAPLPVPPLPPPLKYSPSKPSYLLI